MNPIFLNVNTIKELDQGQLDEFGKRISEEGVKMHLGLTSHEGKTRMALQFDLGETPCILLPADGTVLIDGATKVIDFSYEDTWVTLRKKIGEAPFVGDGMPQTPGPQLVQWMYQRMQQDLDTDAEWTYEECVRLALKRLDTPPNQPSTTSQQNEADAE